MTLEQYGFVVAADAFGNMIFSPIFGYLSDYFGTVRYSSTFVDLFEKIIHWIIMV